MQSRRAAQRQGGELTGGTSDTGTIKETAAIRIAGDERAGMRLRRDGESCEEHDPAAA